MKNPFERPLKFISGKVVKALEDAKAKESPIVYRNLDDSTGNSGVEHVVGGAVVDEVLLTAEEAKNLFGKKSEGNN